MEKRLDFTTGRIVLPLLQFVGPVLSALFLQALYGAIDLMIVGRFAESADISAVGTGSQIMMTFTNLISSLAMGITVLLGQKIGEKNAEEGGRITGSGILLFLVIGTVMTLCISILAPQIASILHAPEEAFLETTSYIRICGAGSIIIISYNLIGSIFRGIGDSSTPFYTVLIACVFNIFGDLLLVAVFQMGARGAAIATVFAQLISVFISLAMIRKKELPFTFGLRQIKWNSHYIKKTLLIGTPIAIQDFLVGISFLIILAIVNSLGLVYSAGVGVSQKVCGFVMLVPVAFMQSMSAFVAQNRGAGKIDRAIKGLQYAIGLSFLAGLLMFYAAFFHGDLLSGIFTKDTQVMNASAEYLKAYAIDCLFTAFLFCFIGFFNGMEYTSFVMAQGIIGAFLVRVPVSYLMSRQTPVSLFYIGLATPCSTILQIVMCFICFTYLKKRLHTASLK